QRGREQDKEQERAAHRLLLRGRPPAAAGHVRLQRSQEVQDVLFLTRGEVVEEEEGRVVRLRAVAVVRGDGRDQIARPAVMQEEDALAEAPQRRGAELVAAGVALR